MSPSETTAHGSSQPEDDVLPSPGRGYGWVVVGSCFILNALTWGVTSVSAFGSSITYDLTNTLVLWHLSDRTRVFQNDREC
jgi:hypothetical protein